MIIDFLDSINKSSSLTTSSRTGSLNKEINEQYFTPMPIASFMSSMFTPIKKNVINFMDAGAGVVVSRTVNKLKNGTKKTIEYYACGAWKNQGTSVCNSNTIRADKAEVYIFERLQQLATNEQLIQDIVDTVNGKRSNNDEPIKREFATLTKELEKLQRKKEKAMEMFEDDLITKVELQQRLNKINELIDQVEIRLQPIKLQMQSLKTHTINAGLIKEIMANFHKAFKRSITQEQQKHLVTLLIKEITINEEREIDSIQIQFNNAVLNYFTEKGVDKSSDDDLSTPFCIILQI
ncbi:hypothetical protein [Bacillus hominis]|uniref:hypothetical protein n=1 Tax=Bacillus hominis TaxID=2817478 RepID=UPI001BB3BDE5|nr:hypothetical protein [Bacillus hominis]